MVRLGKVSIAVKTFGVFGGYGLALAALALVVFGAYDSYPKRIFFRFYLKKVFCVKFGTQV